LVADKLNRSDAGLVSFSDRENEIDAVVGLFNELGGDVHVVAAGMAIDFDDSPDVGLNRRPGKRAARLGLDLRLQLIVLHLLVALEGNPVDDRVLDDRDHQPVPHPVDSDVLKQAGLDQRFQGVIDAGLVKAPTGIRLEIGTDRIQLDAAVPLDGDRRQRLGGGRRRYEWDHANGNQGGEQYPP
jgi:hypothetical protein